MRKSGTFGLALLTLLSLLTSGLLPAQEKGPAKSPRKEPKKWALLIGVDDYIEVRKLRFAGNDQRALAERLISSGFPKDQVVLVHDKAEDSRFRPIRLNIEKQLTIALNMAEPGDLMIVGFSGHGVQMKGKSYLCPEDVQVEKLEETMIPLDAVYGRMAECNASLKLLLVDACRDDVVPEGRRSLLAGRGLGGFGGAKEKPPEGILLLASCAPGQISWEDQELKHGVFMHFLLEGLGGKAVNYAGMVTLDSLRDYAGLETKKYVRDKFNESQTPALRGEISGSFEICTAGGGLSAAMPGLPPSSPSPARTPKAGETITNSIGMKMVLLPAGEFMMGSPESEADRSKDEGPQHRVRITRPFYLGQYPVTLGEFVTFYHDANYKLEMERDNKGDYGLDSDKPSEKRPWAAGFENGNDHPVVFLTWNDAVAFCEWMTKKEGKEYRLPTEAEWEYACRAGSTTRYCFGDSESELGDYAWYTANSDHKTHPVGQKRANAFGLYDVHGNVWQWCADWYGSDYYAASPAADPTGPSSGSSRVLRGGSWLFRPNDDRSANRLRFTPVNRLISKGFRVARTP